MKQAQPDSQRPLQPGDRVNVVGADAQAAAGGTQGTVVGQTDAARADASDPAVIVAIDQGPARNALLDPTDVQRQDDPGYAW